MSRSFWRRPVSAVLGVACLLALATPVAYAQCVTLDAVDQALAQDFDSLATSGTTNGLTLPGWSLSETGGGARDNDQYAADSGSSNTGDSYSYGASGTGERALGSLRSGSLIATFGLCLTNNTGAAIQALDVAYTGEQWRLGTAGRADRLEFQYSLDATSLADGTWTAVDALAFSSPNTTTTGASDGNAAANRSALRGTIAGLTVANGANVWIRWNDADASGADDGLAIDDLALTARGQGGGGLPTLSIADQTAAEGDSGTTPFLFTITASSPAPAGGISVQYATADGTATAGADYRASSGTARLAEGTTSVTISVDVIGDGDTEPNETFLVNLSDASGALIGKGQATATIANDDVTLTAIHAIQGTTDLSPLVGQAVTTRGIVTGRKSNGFFIQAADGDADANPLTSEGVFVFTGNTLPGEAQIGNLVLVSGTVLEFVPAADPLQLSLTEIGSPQVTLLGQGHALPQPVSLSPTFPDPAGPLDQLEPLEGMRVTAASFTVVAPTGGNTNEANASGGSNGQLNLVVTGTARPFREPGIQTPDPAPDGGSIPPIPRWDFNPELLFSDTDALGGPRHDLAVGTTLQNYVGPLDYGFRRYSVHQDPTVTPVISGGMTPTPARLPNRDEFTYATYNVERLFDTNNDPATDDPVLTQAAFDLRLNKASLGLRNALHSPDIVGLVEVENLATLQALATRTNTDARAAGQPDPGYVAYLHEGNDIGGIDVGFLVKTSALATGSPRVEVRAVTQIGKDSTWTEPSGSVSVLNDRPPLTLDAVIHTADGRAFPVTVIQVHQRSLSGVEDDTADGARVRAKRQRQAEWLADAIQAMQRTDPQRNIIVGGDFNAFEFNDGLADVMGTVTGIPAQDAQTAVPGDGKVLLDPALLNLFVTRPAEQRYSFEFDGNAQSLDHIVINQALGAAVGRYGLDHARINADFPEVNRNDPASPSRLSDHDPVIAYFSLAQADLDIQATAGASPVNAGQPLSFGVNVRNLGPADAAYPGVGLALDAVLPDLTVSAPAGWTCDAPTRQDGKTIVACAGNTLANAASARFQVRATAPAQAAGRSITLAASVDAEAYDPVDNNNRSSANIAIRKTGLTLGVTGPASIPRQATTATYQFRLDNHAQVAAAQPQLVIEGNTLTIASRIRAPAGWICTYRHNPGTGTRPIGPRTVTIICNGRTALQAGASAGFTLKANTRPTPDDGIIRLQGSARSALVNDDPTDNTARIQTTVR